jgi:hypothetical protein
MLFRLRRCRQNGYESGMKVNGTHTRTIWLESDGWSVGIIDQTTLPHRYTTLRLTTLAEAHTPSSRCRCAARR